MINWILLKLCCRLLKSYVKQCKAQADYSLGFRFNAAYHNINDAIRLKEMRDGKEKKRKN
jgi:hypothetical protein